MSSEASAQRSAPARKHKIKLFGREYHTNEVAVGILFIVPTLAFMVFTFILPVIDVVDLSFTNFNLKTRTMKYIQLENFKYLLGAEDFWTSLLNTVKYSVMKPSVSAVSPVWERVR